MHKKIGSYPEFSLAGLLTSQWGCLLSLPVSVYIIAMVNVEHPFGGYVEEIPHHHWLLSGFGWVCLMICLVFFQIFPIVFKKSFNRENATIVVEFFHLMLFTLIMYLANLLYVMLVIPPPEITTDYQLHIVYFTVAFNSVPILTFNSIRKIYFMNLNAKIRAETPEILPEEPVVSVPVDLRVLKGRIYQADEILFFRVNGNYLIIYLDSNTPTEHEMLTGSMAQLEELLVLHTGFQRSHRSYLVNTNKMRKCIGNKGGIKFWLHNCDIEFNVYHKKISKFLPFCTKRQKGIL